MAEIGPPEQFTPTPEAGEKHPLTLVAGQISEPSAEHPHRNEDAFFVGKNSFGVYDGMSRPSGGEIASDIACNGSQKTMDKLTARTITEVTAYQRKTLQEADEDIKLTARTNKKLEGIGAAAALGTIFEDAEGNYQFVGTKVEDCSFYHLSKDGKLTKLTNDYYPDNSKFARDVADVVDNTHDLKRDLKKFFSLRRPGIREKARARNVVVSPLGALDPKFMQTVSVQLQEGDSILTLSDGISDNLTISDMEKILTNPELETPQQKVEALLHHAQKKSREPWSPTNWRPKIDDMTGILIMLAKKAIGRAQVVQSDAKFTGTAKVLPPGNESNN